MLKIVKAKPNPSGKDKVGRNIIPSTLAGEWIDIKNEGPFVVALNGLQVWHYAYKGLTGQMEIATTLPTYNLSAGKVLRVHSGGYLEISRLLLVDQIGADYHVFTGRNYIWNNDKPDYPSILDPHSGQWRDQTRYDAYPPDGAILRRLGDKLVV